MRHIRHNKMKRVLTTEWLDELQGDDPRAIWSRRDLRRLNALMAHAGIFRSRLQDVWTADRPRRLVEIGAGDATLMLRLLTAMDVERRGGELVVIDRQPVVTPDTKQRFEDHGWQVSTVEADVFEWGRSDATRYDWCLANLFLHHFSSDALRKLFSRLACRVNLMAACEPRRAPLPRFAARLVGLIGCNEVTRHDAVVSVEAGFAEEELTALWPSDDGWTADEGRAGLFSHFFVTRRNDP